MDTPGVQVLREAHHPISSHCAYQEVCLLPSGEVFAVIRKKWQPIATGFNEAFASVNIKAALPYIMAGERSRLSS